jgi:predicted metal-dependent hydrolase
MSRPEIIDTPAGPAQLKRSHRKTLAISVLPDGTLELVAPEEAPLGAILSRVEKRTNWIKAQRNHFGDMNSSRPVLRYITGATHRYLGRQYRLKVTEGEETRVTLKGGYFHIQVKNATNESVQKALESWYRERAREQITQRLLEWKVWCKQRKLPEPKLRLRKMSKRWGSAMPDGTIFFNPELIKAPSVCVDYVILHEICHLKHPNHGPGFRVMLQQLCPSWQAIKLRLERADS